MFIDLGAGLVLRRSTPADAGRLAEFNARIHNDGRPDHPDEHIAEWTRDLMERPHPTFDPGDFTLVEDNATGRIVSAANLINQTWAYGGIPFGVGRPELVGTQPEYRKRGLVRAQFEVIHQWSAERGHRLQAITGIPFYYRQFGYEMALDLEGSRSGFEPHVPRLRPGQDEPYKLRRAIAGDIPFIAGLYDSAVAARDLVTCVRTPEHWRYEIEGASAGNLSRWEVRVIESGAGGAVGWLAHGGWLWNGGLAATVYELKPGISWLDVSLSVIRYLWATGTAYAARDGQPIQHFGFALGAEHPVYEACADRLPGVRPPYAWYLRLPDLPGFVQHIAPVLEGRLARSVAVGHTGELKLNFYRGGLRLAFTKGRLTACEAWQPSEDHGQAAFPNLTFLQVLFGYRTLAELSQAYPDCWYRGDETRTLLKALFPKQASNVWPVS
jgi:hypothetical protein